MKLLKIPDLDESHAENLAYKLGYTGIVESEYTSTSHEFKVALKHFENIKNSLEIFEKFETTTPRSEERAFVVANMWHHFSAFMPWFLCQASAMVTTNEKRHYVIQTAFEELGMRDVNEIHSFMFWNAAKLTNVHRKSGVTVLENKEFLAVILELRQTILNYKTDEEILGILLGLELPAQENIETVLNSLCFTKALEKPITAHKFFVLHRQIETEHVRLTVSNALRFCPTEQQMSLFMCGLNDGLTFWRKFWKCAENLTQNVIAQRVLHE